MKIRALATFEHMVLDVGQETRNEMINGRGEEATRWRQEEEEKEQEEGKMEPKANLSRVPFEASLITLLARAQQAEMIFSILRQEAADTLEDSLASVALQERSLGFSNESLVQRILFQLDLLHDREIGLSEQEEAHFGQLLGKRRGTHRRRWEKKQLEVGCGVKSWRCFLKLISSKSCFLTLLPASCEQLLSPLFEHQNQLVATCALPLLPIYVYHCHLATMIKDLVEGGQRGSLKKDLFYDNVINWETVEAGNG